MEKHMDLVLITGANKGIGFEVARQLAGHGMHVLLGARDAGRGQAAVEALKAQGLNEVELLEIDVVSQESIEKAAADVTERFGKLDVLINNAGVVLDTAAPSVASPDKLRQTFETNFFGVIAVTQAFVPLLRASVNARIVNVSSGLGSLTQLSDPEYPFTGFNALSYCASKAALNMFSVQLAKELRASGIKVNIADPGYTATDLNGNHGTQTVAEGSEAIVKLATGGVDGPTGTYIDRAGVVPW
jgi:NAD(P)-dependent dehydrogenase (short-subunit alcohol dehydrogenase family)